MGRMDNALKTAAVCALVLGSTITMITSAQVYAQITVITQISLFDSNQQRLKQNSILIKARVQTTIYLMHFECPYYV